MKRPIFTRVHDIEKITCLVVTKLHTSLILCTIQLTVFIIKILSRNITYYCLERVLYRIVTITWIFARDQFAISCVKYCVTVEVNRRHLARSVRQHKAYFTGTSKAPQTYLSDKSESVSERSPCNAIWRSSILLNASLRSLLSVDISESINSICFSSSDFFDDSSVFLCCSMDASSFACLSCRVNFLLWSTLWASLNLAWSHSPLSCSICSFSRVTWLW